MKSNFLHILIVIMLALSASAQTPRTMNYQGYLTDNLGQPITSGSESITFRIYNVASGGSALWNETRTVAVESGVFSVVIGENTPINLPFDTQYWLGITVGGTELSPRTALASAPTAINATPDGIVDMFAGVTPPTGWLLCNGQTVSRTTYANLFAIIGTAYGAGDGSITFHMPDFRGRFARGLDIGAGNDTDAAGRTASNAGGNTGDNVEILKGDALGSHLHLTVSSTPSNGGLNGSNQVSYRGVSGSNSGNYNLYGTGSVANWGRSSAAGGNETRPKNLSVNYMIKY